MDVWKTLKRCSRGTEDGQGMACLPVYGIEWEVVLDNGQLVRLITLLPVFFTVSQSAYLALDQ